MVNISFEQYGQMQKKVDELANKKNPIIKATVKVKKVGRPNLENEQKLLSKENDGRIKIFLKPLSQNDAWKGQRWRSDLYKKYCEDLMMILPKLTLPNPPYKITYEFGFSNKGSDIDNPVKSLGDILQEKYKFNDSQIYEMHVYKKIVKKLGDYISFKIESI